MATLARLGDVLALANMKEEAEEGEREEGFGDTDAVSQSAESEV